MLKKIKTTLSLYLSNWSTWLGVAVIYAGVYYSFYFLAQLTESWQVVTWPLATGQVLVYIYLGIGVMRLCVSMHESAQTNSKNVYTSFKTLFTPLDRIWEPLFLMLALYGVVVLALQITLQPQLDSTLILLSVLLSLLAYSLVFGVLFVTQYALLFNLEADMSITEAYSASVRTALGKAGSTLVVDVVIGMMVFVGYVSQVLLFFLVPMALLLLSVQYYQKSRNTSTVIIS